MRQLDVAIWLFFVDADPISIRTLAAAATSVLADLIEAKNPKGSWRAKIVDDIGLPRATVQSIINEAPNFFKHANRDPDASFLFNDEENDDPDERDDDPAFDAPLRVDDVGLPEVEPPLLDDPLFDEPDLDGEPELELFDDPDFEEPLDLLPPLLPDDEVLVGILSSLNWFSYTLPISR